MKFFFDNNLSPKLAEGLNIFANPDHQVVHLKQKFPANVADEIWMRALAQDDCWVIITADVRISRNPHEVKAWKEAGHTIFFLKPGWTDCAFWVQLTKFTKCFPDIIKIAKHARRGDSFTVSVSGKIES